MTDYSAVLSRRHPGRQWTLNGDDYEGLTMLDADEKPTKKSLDDAWPAVKTEIEAELAAKEHAVTSARNKLAALGLTVDEIKALVG